MTSKDNPNNPKAFKLSNVDATSPNDKGFMKAHDAKTVDWVKQADDHNTKIYMLKNAKLTRSLKFKFSENCGGKDLEVR